MKKERLKYFNWGMSVLAGIGIFVFWYVIYPHALSYQEQYQLFLWTSDYLLDKMCVPGGFSDWFGEFIVQNYYIEWLGALLLALLFMTLKWSAGWIPVALMLWLIGDPSVLLGYLVALLIAIVCHRINKVVWSFHALCELLIIPALYWLTGPLAWVYVCLRIIRYGWHSWALALYLLSLQLFAYHWILSQWTLQMIFTPAIYYRTPMMMPTLMYLIPLATVATITIRARWNTTNLLILSEFAVFILLCFLATTKGYDKDLYELIRQDYLVRNERWDEIVKRAQNYQVKTEFSSVCVNLALSQKRLLAERMFDFYQSDANALIMPRIRDLTSMLPSAEAFWRLGMVNSALRYFFDTQESILNGKKSGRCTKRIVECMIVNGHYKSARKHLSLLEKSLYYKDWAEKTEQLIANENAVNTHPVYGRLRQLRFKNDFLYSHFELYKMFGLLFMNNKENKMALDYFMGQMLLDGQVNGFQKYMPLVQQYGGYSIMPIGYQDALRCIQMRGNVQDSPYGEYAKRIITNIKKKEENDEAH